MPVADPGLTAASGLGRASPPPPPNYQFTLSIHPINTPYQSTLSTHPINTPYHHTLSIHPINTPYQSTLPTHLINTPYQPTYQLHRDAFIVLACDGVFDVMSNEQVVDLLGHHLGYTAYGDVPVSGITTQRCAEACDALLQECLTLGAHDNLSVLVVVCGGTMDMSSAIVGQSSLSPTCALLQSPPLALNKSSVLATPSSGAATRTPVDRTLSRVLYSPSDQSPTGTRSSVLSVLLFIVFYTLPCFFRHAIYGGIIT